MKKLLARLVRQSPAMIVAMLALFVALTGTAVATTSALITGKQIANSSITGADVKNKSLTPKDFKGSVRGARGPAGAAGPAGPAGAAGPAGPAGPATGTAGGDLSGTYPNPVIAANKVTSAKVLDEGLAAEDLAANSVGSSEIATDAVNATEIANNSIDSGEIVDFGLSNQDVGVLFAQVDADATVANSSGGVTASQPGTGTYVVDFGRTISGCAFVATQGEAGVGGAGGAIMGVTDRFGNAEAVFVTARTDAGVLADRAFQLIVVC